MKLFRQILIRIIFLPLILAAGILATAITAVRFMVTPEDLRSMTIYQLQEVLKRPVRIEWAKLSYTGEIKIKGLRVTEPGTGAVDFITADYMYATVSPLALLRRRMEIGSILLVSPKIELIKRADKTWNIGDIFAGYRSPGKKQSLNSIASAEIRDGEIIVTDKAAGKRYAFSTFSLDMSNFKPAEDSSFETSMFFDITGLKKPLQGRLFAKGTVNFAGFNWPAAELKDLSGDLTLSNKRASFTGGLKNFRQPEISLKAQTPAFKSSELAYLFEAPHPFSAPRLNLTIGAVFVSTKTVALKLSSDPFGVKAEGTYDFSTSTPVYNFDIHSRALGVGTINQYTEIPLENPSGKLKPRIRITSRNGRPVLSNFLANVTGSDFSFRGLDVSGLDMTFQLSESFSGSYITASDGQLALGPARLTGLNLKGNISKEELALEFSGSLNRSPLKARMALGSPFTGNKTFYYTGYSKNLEFTATKNLILDITKLFSGPARKHRKTSQLEWLNTLKSSIPSGYSLFKLLYKADHFKHDYMRADDLYLSASLNNITGKLENITGNIAIRSGEGVFYQLDDISEKDRIYYLFTMPLRLISKMNRMGALKFNTKLKDISFSSIGAEYSLNKGKTELKNFYMVGKEFSAYATGQIDFANETTNLKIYTISGKYYSMGSLPEGLTDASGKPALAFTIEGKMTNPVINMLSPKDSAKIIKEAAARDPGINFSKINSLIGGKK